MSDAVGSTAHAFDASREEQGLCPHEKNPAFDAGMVFLCSFPKVLKIRTIISTGFRSQTLLISGFQCDIVFELNCEEVST